jgi:hypothetical protein
LSSLYSISVVIYDITFPIHPLMSVVKTDVSIINIRGLSKNTGQIKDIKHENIQCLQDKGFLIQGRTDSSQFSCHLDLHSL